MALPAWYTNTMDILADLWQRAGTRIIGYTMTALGMLGTLDAFTTQYVAKLLGPKWGGAFTALCMIAGAFTAKRGHKNTADIARQVAVVATDPKQQAVVEKIQVAVVEAGKISDAAKAADQSSTPGAQK